jgi:hypothetical protein
VTAAWIVALGLGAGVLTTLSGVGGGLLITLVLALVWDPHLALAVAAPALLLGNAHRVWLYRGRIDRTVGRWVGVSAFVGAIAGGIVAALLPDTALRVLLLVVAAAALVREGLAPGRGVGRVGLAAGGALVGVLTSTTGGGGLVLGPLTLAAGLRGPTFVATNATVGVTVHVARLCVYGGAGMFAIAVLDEAALLALAIAVGNLSGRAVRPRLGERACISLTWASLAAGLVLAAVGVGLDLFGRGG